MHVFVILEGTSGGASPIGPAYLNEQGAVEASGGYMAEEDGTWEEVIEVSERTGDVAATFRRRWEQRGSDSFLEVHELKVNGVSVELEKAKGT